MNYRAISDTAPLSESLASVSLGAEVLFWRMLSQADPWGCLVGTPRKVHHECLGLRAADYTIEDVRGWLEELKSAGRIIRHRNGTTYIELVDFDRWQPIGFLRGRGPSAFLHPYGIPEDESRPHDKRKARPRDEGGRFSAEHEALWARVARLREDGLSLREIAEEAQISKSQVSRLLSQRCPKGVPNGTANGTADPLNQAISHQKPGNGALKRTEEKRTEKKEQSSKALSRSSARAGRPADCKQSKPPNPGDPVACLVAALEHADTNTEKVLRNLAIPEAAYRSALEALTELRQQGKAPTNDAAWAVARLNRQIITGTYRRKESA